MRFNHLDILEQCFRDKIFGYHKEDVDNFLNLVAEDFKEMTEELDLLEKKIYQKNKDIDKFKAIKNKPTEITPELIKEKAKKIINAAREHANQHKKKAEHELSNLKREIEKLKEEKKNLAETPKQ